MHYRVISIATAAAFAGGLVTGHYTSRGEPKASRHQMEGRKKPEAKVAPRDSDIPETSSVAVSAHSSSENLIVAIQNAAAHPADRQLDAEVSDLINTLDLETVRPIIDAVQALPNQRERNIVMPLLISRWAEADPLEALSYVKAKSGGSENNGLLSSVVVT